MRSIVDMDTGRVIEQEDAFARWYPASLTKLMTAYVAFRAVKAGEITLASPVRMSSNAAKEPPSKMGFAPGSVLTVDNAIKILMVKSANDVATAVAESIGGSVRGFAARMNAEAARLGMTGTHFVNPHGLHSPEQYSTARDLAILAMAIREEFPQHAAYFSIEAVGFGNTVMENYNNLVRRFPGTDGMKTGYTCDSGFNLIATAFRDGRRLMAVVIGAESAYKRGEKAAAMLTRGFATQAETDDADAPRLDAIAPSGTGLDEATNMRETVCSAEARQKRASERKARAEAGEKSIYLSDPEGPPVVVAVSLGGATGPESPVPRFADVPIPTPRPDYAPDVAQGG